MSTPGHPTYRRDIGDSLTLRWSTAADRAGCAFLACLAPGMEEGAEDNFGVRYFEPYTSDTFYAGSATNWAICVDRSRPLSQPWNPSTDSEYLAFMQKEMVDAPEHVVALIYYLPAEFAFEGDAARVPAAKAQIVACRTAYRGGVAGFNIMKGLFEMVHDRARLDGAPIMITSGIPSYYRAHGYEYALSLGPLLTTHVSGLPHSKKTIGPDSPYSLRVADANDLQAIEELVYAARPSSALFSGPGPEALIKQLRWLLGPRDAEFAEYPMYAKAAPLFVLERASGDDRRVVAAAGAQSALSSTLSIHPLLWDGKESAIDVVSTLVPHLIKAVGDMTGDTSKPTTISWVLAEGHSLRCWLLAAQLAVANPPTSLYDGHGTWWLNVLSLPRFLDAIKSALNTRLARARHVLGHTYAAELRLAELRQSVPGAIIQIADAQVESVEEYAVSAADLKASAFAHGGPNVSLPHGALVQLLMGYRSWDELRAFVPDAIADPALVPVLEILFPKMTLSSALYF